jgi:putative membrane protein
MKNAIAYKVSGILAAVVAAAALGVSAQTTAQTTAPAQDAQPTVPPVTAPATTPAVDPAAPVDATAPAAAPAVAADANAAKDFMREAFMANEFSIAASQLAATQGESPDVKAAAQAVLDNGLKTRTAMVAAIQGSTSDMHFDQNFSDDYNTKLGELKLANGADFDTKYVTAQGEVNDKAENVFKAYAATGTDESVKTFAANTLPTLAANGDKLDSVAQGGN